MRRFEFNLFYLLAIAAIVAGLCFLVGTEGSTRVIGVGASALAFFLFAVLQDQERY